MNEIANVAINCIIGPIPVVGDIAGCAKGNADIAANGVHGISDAIGAVTTEISCILAAGPGATPIGAAIGEINTLVGCLNSLYALAACEFSSGGGGGGGGGGGSGGSGGGFGTGSAAASSVGLDIKADVQTLHVESGWLQSLLDPYVAIMGDKSWLESPVGGPNQNVVFLTWLSHFMDLIQSSSDAGEKISDTERAQLLAMPLPSLVSVNQANQFIDRWNRSVDYWHAGIFSAADVPAGQSADFIDTTDLLGKMKIASTVNDLSLSQTGYANPTTDITNKFDDLKQLISGGAGTCAKVVIQIDQKVVLTRSAFKGTLEITDGNANVPIQSVQVALKITDAAGKDDTANFGIKSPLLVGLTATDGSGVIAPGAVGTATYTIVPTRDAAPVTPTVYYVGGTLSYADPDTGLLVTHNLIAAAITVMPDPLLTLDYFLQRDVIGDDPFTAVVEPSQPFDLGLIVTNSGHGTAQELTITSSQPKIIENQKGLLIDFKIIGSMVGDQPVTPSLTIAMGNIGPGQTQTGIWQLTSSLQGRFIDYSATFEQTDNFGNPKTSLIDAVNIHELIHTVRDDRPGADDKPDFLANDIPDPGATPDTLYLSDGTKAVVNVAAAPAVDHAVTLTNRTVHLTATMTSGWDFLRLPDPGAGYKLLTVNRSDGKVLRVGDNVWQTTKVFAEGNQAYLNEPRLQLLDYNGTGDYTLTYVLDDPIPPQMIKVDAIAPDPRSIPVSTVNVELSKPIDITTFDYNDITLQRNGHNVPLSPAVTVALAAGTTSTYTISGLDAFTAADGAYLITVTGAGIQDYGANAGLGVQSATWSNGVAPVFVTAFGPVTPNPRSTPVDSVDLTFSKPIDPTTFERADLTLMRGGTPVALPAGVTLANESGNTYRISGLATLDALDGAYALKVDATTIQDLSATAGLGSQTVTWTVDTVPPTITAVETLATNPRNIVVQTLDVTFSEPINPATFDRSDVTLTRNGAPLVMDDRVTVSALSGSVYRISGINWFVGQEGTYVVTISATAINDLAGNAGVGSASTSWVMDTTPPVAPANLGITPDHGTSSTDGLTNVQNVTFHGTLTETGLLVHIADSILGDLGYATVTGTTFSAPLTLSLGVHHLTAYSVDAAANVSRKHRCLRLPSTRRRPWFPYWPAWTLHGRRRSRPRT